MAKTYDITELQYKYNKQLGAERWQKKRFDGLWVDLLHDIPPDKERWSFFLERAPNLIESSNPVVPYTPVYDIVVAQCWLNNFLTLPVEELRLLTSEDEGYD